MLQPGLYRLIVKAEALPDQPFTLKLQARLLSLGFGHQGVRVGAAWGFMGNSGPSQFPLVAT